MSVSVPVTPADLSSGAEIAATRAVDRLRDQMSGYRLDFVKTGNPNGAGRPNWTTIRNDPDSVLELNANTRHGSRLVASHADLVREATRVACGGRVRGPARRTPVR